MNNTVIVKLMTNLIEKKFYNTKDEAVAKLDVYFAMNRISEEEYATLTLLAETTYAEVLFRHFYRWRIWRSEQDPHGLIFIL